MESSLPFVAQVIIAEASRLLELLLSAEAVIKSQMKQVGVAFGLIRRYGLMNGDDI